MSLDLSLGSKLLSKTTPTPPSRLAARPSDVQAVGGGNPDPQGWQAAWDAFNPDDLGAIQRSAYDYNPPTAADYELGALQRTAYADPSPAPYFSPESPYSMGAYTGNTPQGPEISRTWDYQPPLESGGFWSGVRQGLTSPLDILDAANTIAASPGVAASSILRGTPLPGGTTVGGQVDQSPPVVRIPANFLLDAAPYIAAGAVSGGALNTPFVAQAGLSELAALGHYGAGDTSLRQLGLQTAMNAPVLAPAAIHGAGLVAPDVIEALGRISTDPRVVQARTRLASESGMAKLPGEPPANPLGFNPTPEELTHFRTLIEGGDWTSTPGARIGAKSALNMLLKGEAPSEKQFGLLQRALASTPKKTTAVEAMPKSTTAAEHITFAEDARGLSPEARAIGEELNALPSRGGTQPRLGEQVPDTAGFSARDIQSQRLAAQGRQVQMESLAASSEELRALPQQGQQLSLSDKTTDAYIGALSTKGAPTEVKSRFRRVLEGTVAPLQLVKTIKTSFDIGWGGRQGWRLLPRNPKEWIAMYGKQYKALGGKGYAQIMDDARAFENFARSQQAERPLAFLEKGTGSAATSGEEFLSTWTKYIPGLKQSEQAYVAPGNWMRQAILDKQVRRLVAKNKAPVSDADFQLLIDNLNNASLRGNTEWLGKVNAETLGSALFSLKGQVSGPQFALDAVRAVVNGGNRYSPEARKIVAEQFGAYVAAGMSTLGLAAATGWGLDKAGKPSFVNVDLNDLSPTFGQISVGEMRWNFWGADQSLVRTAIQASRQKVQKPGLPAEDASARHLVSNFAGNKIAPGIPKLLWDELVNDGTSYQSGVLNDTGLDINTPLGFLTYAFNQVIPIGVESGITTYQEQGPAYVAPSLLAETQGLSTSTYDASPSEDELKSAAKKDVLSQMPSASDTFKLPVIQESFAPMGFDPKGYDSLEEYKAAYVEKYAPAIAKADGVSLPEAKTRAGKHFDAQQPVRDFKAGMSNAELYFWQQNPKLLDDMVTKGIVVPTQAQQQILDAYRQAIPAGTPE